jgi:AcrR family transcriptional regulator
MSRRERMREGTREEIKALARQQMAASGTAAVSLGAIARAMDLVPSALYRYYASRDELITALIIDAYEGLAEALSAAAAVQPNERYGARLLATSLAYRAWAVAQPMDFLLIFGNPIPGYHAPLEETLSAALKVFSAFLTIMQEAYAAGELNPSAAHRQASAAIDPDQTIARWNPGIDPLVSYSGIACWAKLHGMVMLELTGHLAPGLDLPSFYRGECLLLLADIGLAP